MICLNIIVIFIIAVSLSMDAFSLSLVYGTLKIKNKDILILSIIVGLYHFFMPILGLYFGKFVEKLFPISSNLLLFLVLVVIGIEMIIDSCKSNNKVKYMKIYELLIFGFAVSIDSFSVGVGLNSFSSNIFIPSFVFSLTSLFFTYIGLILGRKINLFAGKISTIVGGIILIIIGIIYLF